jgi:ribonucleoside-diphosphate reductase alpha chain
MSAPAVERKRLPNRRGHEVVKFKHAGFTYMAGVGRFSDGQLAEVFLTGAKVGTSIETQARDAAITASLYFQMGGLPQTLKRALTRNTDGSASGPLGRLLDLLLVEDDGARSADRRVQGQGVVLGIATDVSPDDPA